MFSNNIRHVCRRPVHAGELRCDVTYAEDVATLETKWWYDDCLDCTNIKKTIIA